jgi:hypothetical protein
MGKSLQAATISLSANQLNEVSTIVNNRKNGRLFQLGLVSMQPLPARPKLMHRKTLRTAETERIRSW